MNNVLWVLQILLGVMFLLAGFIKVSRSKAQLLENMAWVEDVSGGNVKLIGTLEILAALGLVLPQLTGILPWLTPLAAVGLVLIMLGAITIHVRRGEIMSALVNASLLALAAFIAYGRFAWVPA